MADRTPIEWTDASWSPIAAFRKSDGKRGWACTKPSPGCKHCYAERINERLGTGLPYTHAALDQVELRAVNLDQPLRWRRPRRIFVESMSDLFGEFMPDEMIDQVFRMMFEAKQHVFQVLTKRAERMRKYVEDRWSDPKWPPAPNIWLGVSVENQEAADERIPHLTKAPCRVRFLSCEPLLGPVDLSRWIDRDEIRKAGGRWTEELVDWVICGGESGPGARPMHPDWARAIRDQCVAAGVPFHFKQWGEYGTGSICMTTGLPTFRQFSSFEDWVCKASSRVRGGLCIDQAGNVLKSGADFARARDANLFPVTILDRVGKKVAGRLLDGREWNEMPATSACDGRLDAVAFDRMRDR